MPNLPEAMKVFTRLGDYPGLTLKAQINSIICFGYQVLGEKAKVISAWDFKAWKKDVNDDREVVKAAYEILKDADAVVTHNGKRFDWKFLNTRLMVHGLPSLPPINHIDTCQISKQHMFLLNNKLDTLAKALTDQKKMDNGGWGLWVKVMQRDKSAQKKMAEYCRQDVITLAAVFKRLKQYASNLPNQNLFTTGKRNHCPSCGSSRLERRGYRYTKTSAYQRYQCQDCFSWSRTNVADEMPR